MDAIAGRLSGGRPLRRHREMMSMPASGGGEGTGPREDEQVRAGGRRLDESSMMGGRAEINDRPKFLVQVT